MIPEVNHYDDYDDNSNSKSNDNKITIRLTGFDKLLNTFCGLADHKLI